ncbi:MAG: hypothetical protein QOG63_889 [Thermoleophilaceae bacterium]|nr:hypothetical protein [Thermoleophilaceae bacterium]
MSLTLGTGPFGHKPGGQLNSRIDGPRHVLYFEDFPRRIRAELGGETVIDTTAGKLLYESSIPPVLYVPLADVRRDLIEPTDHTSHCPFKGDASYWTVRAGGRSAENALWGYPEPIESAAWLLGYVAAYRDRFDAWCEEDEPLPHGMIRDPYHRVEVRSSSARVTVRANGETIAVTERPKLLFETGVAPRAYVPLADVRGELLVESDKTSFCPYKGTATHWSVRAGDATLADVAWTFEEPFAESAPTTGFVSFLGDGIEVEIDREQAAALRPAA